MKYRPEIDGLRTVAVMPVVLFHLGYGFLSGGYFGVDVFFVISGFLITKILTENIVEQKFSMIDFWIRRVKRLLPALLSVVLVTILVSSLFVFKPIMLEITADVFPAIFSYFNFHALSDFGNYWGGKSNNSFFLHVWSLSVEEQFYLFYPFLLFFSYKFFKGFIKPLVVITLLSFLFFVFYISKDKDFTFYMLPSRIWELSLGGIISLIKYDAIKQNSISGILSIIGLLLVILSYFIGTETISTHVVLPVLGASLVILFSTPQNFVGQILSNQILVKIGKLSYSIYLWHWPIIVFFKNFDYQLHHINRHLINSIILILTIFLSYLTYRFVENKTRNFKHTPIIVIILISILSVSTVYFSKQFNIYYKTEFIPSSDYFRFYDISPTQVIPEKNNPIDYGMDMPNRSLKFSEAYKKEGIVTKLNNKNPEFVLFGDSHGVMWAKLLDEISDEFQLSRAFYTSTASNPLFNLKNINDQPKSACYTNTQRIDYVKSLLGNIEKWRPKFFIIICRWEGFTDINKQNLNDLISLLGDKNIKVILFNQPPRLSFMGNKNAAQYFSYLNFKALSDTNLVDLYNNESVLLSNSYIQSLQKKYNHVKVYDVFDRLLINDSIMVSAHKDVFYYDDDHLSYSGTKIFKDEIKRLINDVLETH